VNYTELLKFGLFSFSFVHVYWVVKEIYKVITDLAKSGDLKSNLEMVLASFRCGYQPNDRDITYYSQLEYVTVAHALG